MYFWNKWYTELHQPYVWNSTCFRLQSFFNYGRDCICFSSPATVARTVSDSTCKVLPTMAGTIFASVPPTTAARTVLNSASPTTVERTVLDSAPLTMSGTVLAKIPALLRQELCLIWFWEECSGIKRGYFSIIHQASLPSTRGINIILMFWLTWPKSNPVAVPIRQADPCCADPNWDNLAATK